MGSALRIAGAARLSRRRMAKLRSPRGADAMIFGWLAVVVVVRFAQNCSLAVRELTRGSLVVGRALAEFSMLHFLLVALLLSLLSAVLASGPAGLDRRRLALSAVGLRSLLPAELLVLLTRPTTALTAALMIPAAAPLLALDRPAAAVSTLALAFLAALLGGAGLGAVLAHNRAASGFSGPVRFLSAAAVIALVLANFDFTWSTDAVRLLVFGKSSLLQNTLGHGLLPALRPWGPWSWIVTGRVGAGAALAASAFALYAAAHSLIFRAAGRTPGTRATGRARGVQKAGVGTLAGARGRARGRARAGHAVVKPAAAIFRLELPHLAFSAAGLLCIAAGIGFAAWLAGTAHPSIGIPLLGGSVIVLSSFAWAVNVFGLDGGAVRRYALAGIRWDGVFQAKNRAWLIATAACLVPLSAVTAFRLGPAQGLSFALSAALVLALTVAWGNLSSILFPSARSAGGSASREGPPFVNQAAPFLFGGIIIAVHMNVAPFGSAGFDAAVAACAAATLALRMVFLRRVSRGFEQELEALLGRLKA